MADLVLRNVVLSVAIADAAFSVYYILAPLKEVASCDGGNVGTAASVLQLTKRFRACDACAGLTWVNA